MLPRTRSNRLGAYYIDIMSNRHQSFHAFWPHYLMAHRDPLCRRIHYIGTTGALAGLILAVATLDPFWALGGFVFAYAMAWTGHFAVERNRRPRRSTTRSGR